MTIPSLRAFSLVGTLTIASAFGLMSFAAFGLAPSAAFASTGHEAPAHGEQAEAGHAAPAHGGGEGGHTAAAHEGGHGGDAHHAPTFRGDDDGDGTPNWRDSDAGEGVYVLGPIAFHLLNLLLLIGLALWGAAPIVRDMLRSRAHGIRTSIDAAAKLHADAQAHHDAIASRLAALDTEIADLLARARTDADEVAGRIEARATAAAASIAETATRQIADEARRATQAIRAEAVELAVELAEGILRKQLQAGDQRRLAEQFLSSVQGSAPGGDGHV
ncbi:MAG: hypothetical protein H6733_01040 [Alphaproteobacteria bacterium]|nr:hypothetical protein [Alphaproteobacteria bacterium]